jgi:hypothetical protein
MEFRVQGLGTCSLSRWARPCSNCIMNGIKLCPVFHNSQKEREREKEREMDGGSEKIRI